jgi:hypothetical protein
MEERAYAQISPEPQPAAQADPFDAPLPRRGTPAAPLWRRRPVQLGAAAAAVAIGVGVYFATQSGGQVHVRGTLTLAPGGFDAGGNGCEGSGGYSDISAGTAVVVGGATGQTVGIGALGPGQEDDSSNCVFSFDVAVPSGQSVYTVTISHRGTQTLSSDELTNGINLSLGSN